MSFLYSSWVLEETNLNLSRNSLWRSNLTYQTDHPSPFVASSPYQGSCFAKQRVAVSIKLDRPCGFVFQIGWRVSSRCWRSSFQLVSKPYAPQVCLSIFFSFLGSPILYCFLVKSSILSCSPCQTESLGVRSQVWQKQVRLREHWFLSGWWLYSCTRRLF